MSSSETTVVRNALSSAFAALCDSGSYFELRASTTVVSKVFLNAGQRWTAPVAGVMTLFGLPLIDPVPDALGTLDNYILCNAAGTPLTTGDITITGGGGSLTVDNPVIGAGDAAIITGFTRTQAAS